MPRPVSQHPTELELEILKILWRHGSSSARRVRDTLAPTRDLAMTTVVTVLNKMVQKGQLEREQRSKAQGGNLYTPAITQRRTAQRVLSDLKRRLFGGSASEFLRALLEANEGVVDRRELDEMKRMIEQREREVVR